MMQQPNNPLLCDPETGVCEIPGNSTTTFIKEGTMAIKKPIVVTYFTDPICSSCWGIEPQLKRMKLEYGSCIEIDYRMGGLLPDWSYNSGGISKPSDVARHWDEVSAHYDMPIDGDIWLEDPLHSSFPPSIAFKAAQLQHKEKAILFLRVIREMVFLHKKNITRWEHLAPAAQKAGLDSTQLKADLEGSAKNSFEEDLRLAGDWGVKGFPTMFFNNTDGDQQVVYGSKPHHAYVDAIQQLLPGVLSKPYDKHWSALFFFYQSLTIREFSELTQMVRSEAEQKLEQLTADGQLKKIPTKNGSLWAIKK